MNYKISDILSYEDKHVEKKQWRVIEGENRIIFPEDYKWFLEQYGVGAINDFLWILSPFCENKNLNSIEQYKLMKNSYEMMKSNYPKEYTFSFYNDGKGLFPWGITDNGDELYWNYINNTNEIVILASRYTDSISYEMNMDDFLYRVLTKKIKCPIFPDDFVLEKNYYVSVL